MEKKKIISSDVIVIGAGAAGMMAGLSAAKEGVSVRIIEHMEKAGKKILVTGNGKCNYTNEEMDIEKFRGEQAFIKKALEEFTEKDTMDFFKEMGIRKKVKNGYCYPTSGQASSMVDAFLLELGKRKVKIHCNTQIHWIKPEGHGFLMDIGEIQFACEKVILATGSKAAKVTGSDGSGYLLAEQFGHSIETVLPALVPLKAKESFLKKISGVRFEAECTLCCGEASYTEYGEVQFTEYGVSGIVIFQLSRYGAQAVAQGVVPTLHMNFVPEETPETLLEELRTRQRELGEGRTCEQFLNGWFPKKMIPVFLECIQVKPGAPCTSMKEQELKRLVQCMTDFTVTITGTKDFDQAQVCMGGVCTQEVVSETMESKLQKGLYFAGELLDVDGKCGGYNLQWAWSSGYVAGKSAAASVKESIEEKE